MSVSSRLINQATFAQVRSDIAKTQRINIIGLMCAHRESCETLGKRKANGHTSEAFCGFKIAQTCQTAFNHAGHPHQPFHHDGRGRCLPTEEISAAP